ncbi:MULTISPECIES: GTPase HflX [unclassified Faecalibacterium]|uniref:GTPase HflX n=1 Tax=unclassified Faecalibacterium TaxID=2646395 RepID=UPI000B3A13AF|nr:MULTISPECIES: GTPase HflX [unclassified Faecalibacterium]OUN36945.1 GTPase HflX [Faecalibacterium sp. An77]OUP29066.1 GTPase HflX [Faecalibacterium sp. An192]OUQ38752.1 GTPase HflX [Faecalibacterium sp. An122]
MSELYDILVETPPTPTLLLALDQGAWDCERSLGELAALCEANHMEAVGEVVQKRSTPEAGTVLGSGKLEEARMAAEQLGAQCAVFDGELTGSQIRNISAAVGVEVIDRTMLILEIFRSRAVTNEGKLQTELALLKYRLPRLQGMGESLSRQGGGGGGGGGARRGAGETKLELDRRHIHARIDTLAERLAEMEKRRGESRRARAKTGMPVVSLVGYTNVGKSSLMNALCGPSVAEADMLFATLDPTSRKLVLPSGMAVLLVDTVGFVSRLPHNLVEAFKSTLEEAAWSDVIVQVADAADPLREEQLAVTQEVLDSLDCDDIPRLTVYNKCDKPGAAAFDPDILLTSAKTGLGLDRLLQRLDQLLSDRVRTIRVLLPYDALGLAAPMRERGSVLTEEYRPEGLYLEGIVKREDLHVFENYLV